jgi:deoxyribodipyrimidine photolyase-related protein
VAEQFSGHFGDLEPFHLAVTRAQALYALRKFIDERLAFFGDYQDAMVEGEPWMYHSHLSFYLNCGLLDPLEWVRKRKFPRRQTQAAAAVLGRRQPSAYVWPTPCTWPEARRRRSR